MPSLHSQYIPITVNASGDATVYSQAIHGLLYAVVYQPGASGLDTGADLTITDDATGHALLTVTNGGTSTVVLMPRGATVNTSNVASLYAAGGTAVNDLLPIVGRVKVVVAQGGTSKSGGLTLVWVGM